jgi:putative dimethyl sulfoxide reductase chaperone
MDQEVLDVVQARLNSYTFLAQIYREEVSLPLLAEWVRRPELWDGSDAGEGQATLALFMRRTRGQHLEKVRVDLAVDFASLFLNAGAHPVPPYESVYTSQEALLMQKARDDVVRDYAEEGLERVTSSNEPEDHIAIELEFMAHLCRKTIDSLKGDDGAAAVAILQKQEQFLSKHLGVWVPKFCEEMQRASGTDFYRGIAQMTAELIALDRSTVQDLLAELQQPQS